MAKINEPTSLLFAAVCRAECSHVIGAWLRSVPTHLSEHAHAEQCIKDFTGEFYNYI